jgi:hypothetical protein
VSSDGEDTIEVIETVPAGSRTRRLVPSSGGSRTLLLTVQNPPTPGCLLCQLQVQWGS